MSSYSTNDILNAIAAASKALSGRKEEVNRLNVFPVPDGDTGTNMSLTLESVVGNIAKLPIGSDAASVRKAITTGALMGARGNSGVITSQILRGLCEGSVGAEELNTHYVANAFEKAVEVAFQAVRKPVEGTILTVLRDSAAAAVDARKRRLDTGEALDAIVTEAYASVQRTPDFLPVLKENGVVDAGGYGLAILFDAFVSALTGKEGTLGDELAFARGSIAPKVEIEQINDWEGSEYRYCNEFLVDSDVLDTEQALEFLSTMGDCELCVGCVPKFKVHVHSNHPDQVLAYFLERGQISEVFIHNMDLQSQDRVRKIAQDSSQGQDGDSASEGAGDAGAASGANAQDAKPLGFVAVAAGSGNADILRSLGVDVVVEGGQTMNPSTKDILEAIESVPAGSVIVFPNNSNIIMAASSACELSGKECRVVPTKSVPDGIAAMFAADPDVSIDDNVESMEEAVAEVSTGEITTAIKSSKDRYGNKIRKGNVIGIADGQIECVGKSIVDVTLDLMAAMGAEDSDTLTLLGGEDLSLGEMEALESRIAETFPDVEIDAHVGGQPLYPVIFSLE